MLSNQRIGAVFEATVQATEEAIINAMVGATTMTGINGNTIKAVPHEDLKRLLGEQQRERLVAAEIAIDFGEDIIE